MTLKEALHAVRIHGDSLTSLRIIRQHMHSGLKNTHDFVRLAHRHLHGEASLEEVEAMYTSMTREAEIEQLCRQRMEYEHQSVVYKLKAQECQAKINRLLQQV